MECNAALFLNKNFSGVQNRGRCHSPCKAGMAPKISHLTSANHCGDLPAPAGPLEVWRQSLHLDYPANVVPTCVLTALFLRPFQLQLNSSFSIGSFSLRTVVLTTSLKLKRIDCWIDLLMDFEDFLDFVLSNEAQLSAKFEEEMKDLSFVFIVLNSSRYKLDADDSQIFIPKQPHVVRATSLSQGPIEIESVHSLCRTCLDAFNYYCTSSPTARRLVGSPTTKTCHSPLCITATSAP